MSANHTITIIINQQRNDDGDFSSCPTQCFKRISFSFFSHISNFNKRYVSDGPRVE